VGTPSLTVLKSRSRTLFNSSAIVLGVAQFGSRAATPSPAPMARPTKRVAITAAISLAEAAANAGHMNARRESCRPVGSYMKIYLSQKQTDRVVLGQTRRQIAYFY
jgi:hypothetical protein